MGFEEIVAILKALVTGKKGLIEVIAEDPRLILIPFITAAITVALVYFKHPAGPKPGPGLAAFGVGGMLAAALVLLPGPRHDGTAPSPPNGGSPTTHAIPASVRFETHDEMTLTGRALAPPVANSAIADCESRCVRESECRGYVFDNKILTCTLKAEMGTLMKFPGSKSGVRLKKSP